MNLVEDLWQWSANIQIAGMITSGPVVMEGKPWPSVLYAREASQRAVHSCGQLQLQAPGKFFRMHEREDLSGASHRYI